MFYHNIAGHNYIGTEHLLLGLLREGEGVAARVLENLGADPSNIRTQVIRMVGESTESVGAGVGGGSSGNKMPTLEEYGTNLTKLAEEVGFLDILFVSIVCIHDANLDFRVPPNSA